jgi:hypothetical protein
MPKSIPTTISGMNASSPILTVLFRRIVKNRNEVTVQSVSMLRKNTDVLQRMQQRDPTRSTSLTEPHLLLLLTTSYRSSSLQNCRQQKV